jgi:hypothetical protein
MIRYYRYRINWDRIRERDNRNKNRNKINYKNWYKLLIGKIFYKVIELIDFVLFYCLKLN